MDPIEKAYRQGYGEAIEDVRKMLIRNMNLLDALLESNREGVTTDEKESKGVK